MVQGRSNVILCVCVCVCGLKYSVMLYLMECDIPSLFLLLLYPIVCNISIFVINSTKQSQALQNINTPSLNVNFSYLNYS